MVRENKANQINFKLINKKNILDTESEAITYCKKRREILPKAYSKQKKEKANKKKALSDSCCNDNITNNIVAPVNEEKILIWNEIQTKMSKMDQIYIELDDSEIEIIQDVLEEDENIQHTEVLNDVIMFHEPSGTFPKPFTSKIDPDILKSCESDLLHPLKVVKPQKLKSVCEEALPTSNNCENDLLHSSSNNDQNTPNNCGSILLPIIKAEPMQTTESETSTLVGDESDNGCSENEMDPEHLLNIMHLHFPGQCYMVKPILM